MKSVNVNYYHALPISIMESNNIIECEEIDFHFYFMGHIKNNNYQRYYGNEK